MFTVIAFHPDLQYAGAWPAKFPGASVLVEGTPAVELDPRLPVEREDIVIVKKGASAFFGTNLVAVLTANAVDTVMVCGATTSGCVRASVGTACTTAFRRSWSVTAWATRAAGPHEANLFDMAAKYADVIDLEEALAYVAGLPDPAATPPT